MAHEVELLLAGYALGALDPGEHMEVEEHLDGCRECRAALLEYVSTAEGLLYAPTSVDPSARVRTQLADRVAGESTPRRSNTRLRNALIGLAVGLFALLVVNLALFLQTTRLISQGQNLAAQQRAGQAALAISSYPSSKVAVVEEGAIRGTFVYDPTLPVAVMHIWGLEPPPAGHDYQAWLIQPDGTREAGGLLQISEQSGYAWLMIEASTPLSTYLGLGLTLEPVGGSDQPTGPRVLGADL